MNTPSKPRYGCNAKLSHDKLQELLKAVGIYSAYDFGIDAPTVPGLPGIVTSIDTVLPIGSNFEFYGRMAVVHAITDIHAANAKPFQANISLQVADDMPELDTESLLIGVISELKKHGTTLSKGHTIVGSEPTVTVSVIGRAISNIEFDECGTYDIVMSKRLGLSSSFYIADRLNDCDILDRLSTEMLMSHQDALHVIGKGCVASDVTGHGLYWTLTNISNRHHLSITLDIENIPVAHYYRDVPFPCSYRSNLLGADTHYTSHTCLFLSEICGPIIIFTKYSDTSYCIAELKRLGFSSACCIGRAKRGEPRIYLDYDVENG